MKHLTLIASAIVWFAAPALAQFGGGGPVQLHNPHGDAGGGSIGGGGGGSSFGGSSSMGNAGSSFGVSGGGSFAGGGFAGGPTPLPPGQGFPGEGPTGMPPAPPVTMLADGAYLFILRGDTLMQFDKKTLRLLNSVELPHPAPPAPNDIATHTAPPLRRGFGTVGGGGFGF